MSWWQYAFAVLVIVFSGVVASIQLVEKDSFGDSKYPKFASEFVANNKLPLTFGLSLLTGFGTFATVFFQPRKVRKEFRESLMDGIFEQVLDNDRNNGRITLFYDVGTVCTWWLRIKDFFSLLKRGWDLKKVWSYCRGANYIRIHSRWGTEHRNSKTYFCVNFQTADKCQGVAGQVRQKEVRVVVNLPRLDGIDLDSADEANEILARYMKLGHISDIEVLRGINRKAPFIYGDIISANGGRRKYVLVIDSWGNKTPFTKGVIGKVLPAYVKQISASFG